MSQRVRVYVFLAVVAVLGGGGYFLNEQFHFLGGVANAEEELDGVR